MSTYPAEVPPPYDNPPYQQAPPYGQQVVYQETIVTQPLLVSTTWSEIPQRHRCQFCSHDIVTEVVYETGTMTWLVAGGLLLFGCWLGCCLIPFCVDSVKGIRKIIQELRLDPVHLCPHCHNVVGRKSRIS